MCLSQIRRQLRLLLPLMQVTMPTIHFQAYHSLMILMQTLHSNKCNNGNQLVLQMQRRWPKLQTSQKRSGWETGIAIFNRMFRMSSPKHPLRIRFPSLLPTTSRDAIVEVILQAELAHCKRMNHGSRPSPRELANTARQ